jgi:hypothetical protein
MNKATRQSGGSESQERKRVFMAIGIYFSPAALQAEKYDEGIRLLKKAGAGNPAGRSYHAAFGSKDKLMVFEIWTSQAAFDKFGKTLMPILQQLGIDPGQPTVMPVHKAIVPAAKVTSPKLPKKLPKKQAKAVARRPKR